MIVRLTSAVLTAIAASVWVFIGWLFWLAFIDSNDLVVHESTAWNLDGKPQTEFRAGDRFLAHRYICTSKAVPGEFTIEIHGVLNGFVLPVAEGRLGQVDGCQTRNVVTPLPPTLPIGDYRLRAFTIYDVNPLRTLRYELPPIEFSVVP